MTAWLAALAVLLGSPPPATCHDHAALAYEMAYALQGAEPPDAVYEATAADCEMR